MTNERYKNNYQLKFDLCQSAYCVFLKIKWKKWRGMTVLPYKQFHSKFQQKKKKEIWNTQKLRPHPRKRPLCLITLPPPKRERSRSEPSLIYGFWGAIIWLGGPLFFSPFVLPSTLSLSLPPPSQCSSLSILFCACIVKASGKAMHTRGARMRVQVVVFPRTPRGLAHSACVIKTTGSSPRGARLYTGCGLES